MLHAVAVHLRAGIMLAEVPLIGLQRLVKKLLPAPARLPDKGLYNSMHICLVEQAISAPARMRLTYSRLRPDTTRHTGRCTTSSKWWFCQKLMSRVTGNASTCRAHEQVVALPADVFA